MSHHIQSRRKLHIQNISGEMSKAVDSAISNEACPPAIIQTCLEKERLPRKLHKKQGQVNLRTLASGSTSLERLRKSASLLFDAKRSLGRQALSHPLEVRSCVRKPLSLPYRTQKRLVSDGRILMYSTPVADHRFPAPFGPSVSVPDPLRSNPPFAQTKIIGSPSRGHCGQGCQSEFQKKLEKDTYDSSILSAVTEGSDEDRRQLSEQPSSTGKNNGEVLQVSHELLAATNKRLEEENHQLNSALHELISERILLTNEVANLHTETKATEDALMGLWALFKPHLPELDNITSVTDVRNAIQRLSLGKLRERSFDNSGAITDAENQGHLIASLEKELIQQARFLEHCRIMETAGRKNTRKLSIETKKMKAQLSEAKANRQQLKDRLEASERRFQRLEYHILQNTWAWFAECRTELPFHESWDEFP